MKSWWDGMTRGNNQTEWAIFWLKLTRQKESMPYWHLPARVERWRERTGNLKESKNWKSKILSGILISVIWLNPHRFLFSAAYYNWTEMQFLCHHFTCLWIFNDTTMMLARVSCLSNGSVSFLFFLKVKNKMMHV